MIISSLVNENNIQEEAEKYNLGYYDYFGKDIKNFEASAEKYSRLDFFKDKLHSITFWIKDRRNPSLPVQKVEGMCKIDQDGRMFGYVVDPEVKSQNNNPSTWRESNKTRTFTGTYIEKTKCYSVIMLPYPEYLDELKSITATIFVNDPNLPGVGVGKYGENYDIVSKLQFINYKDMSTREYYNVRTNNFEIPYLYTTKSIFESCFRMENPFYPYFYKYRAYERFASVKKIVEGINTFGEDAELKNNLAYKEFQKELLASNNSVSDFSDVYYQTYSTLFDDISKILNPNNNYYDLNLKTSSGAKTGNLAFLKDSFFGNDIALGFIFDNDKCSLLVGRNVSRKGLDLSVYNEDSAVQNIGKITASYNPISDKLLKGEDANGKFNITLTSPISTDNDVNFIKGLLNQIQIQQDKFEDLVKNLLDGQQSLKNIEEVYNKNRGSSTFGK